MSQDKVVKAIGADVFPAMDNVATAPISSLQSCGLRKVDNFIGSNYDDVPGMSSRLSALTAAAILNLQTCAGLHGNVAEIGTFEGRFFVPLAMALEPSERAFGIDRFDWPNPQVRDRLEGHLERFGVLSRTIVIAADSRDLSPDRLVTDENNYRIRFFHIDGDHEITSLAGDLRLAISASALWGVICVDDMLSPAYPELYLAVRQILDDELDWTVFCIVDRQSLVASAKYFLCRKDRLAFYVNHLRTVFQPHVWRMGGRINGNIALILTEKPFLPIFA